MSTSVVANPRRIRLSADALDSTHATRIGSPACRVSLPSASGRAWWWRSGIFLLIALFGVILWGGYTQGWEWTGISDKDTLWHWMQVLMAPIAFAALPGVLRDHRAMRRERKLMILGLAAVFVGFVIVSYIAPLNWTGFTGNTLWDWLSLLLLPIAITSVRFFRAERTLTWAHYGSAAVILAGFGAW